jgi:hypothetical protein
MSRPVGSSPSPPWAPSEDWIEAFARECTEQLYEDARRFAAWRAGPVRRAGGLADDYYIRELVQDVLSDTAAGVLRWDPSTKTLRAHVWDAIRTRTHHDRVRAERYRHHSVDMLAPDAPDRLLAEIERAVATRAPTASPATAALAAAGMAELRASVEPASLADRLLDAFEAGGVNKADAILLTGMSNHEYETARHQITRRVREIHRRWASTGAKLKEEA